MKISTSHDPREHFAIYILGRLSTAGLQNALEQNISWEASELFQGQGAGEDSKEEFQDGKANT